VKVYTWVWKESRAVRKRSGIRTVRDPSIISNPRHLPLEQFSPTIQIHRGTLQKKQSYEMKWEYRMRRQLFGGREGLLVDLSRKKMRLEVIQG